MEGSPDPGPDSNYHQDLLFGHQGALKEDLSAFENLQFASAMDGAPVDDAHILSALFRLGLKGREQLPVRVLSAGQKRRVALSRLLCRPSTLWVLDEPFTALDVKAVELLCTLINEHLTAGGMAVPPATKRCPARWAGVATVSALPPFSVATCCW